LTLLGSISVIGYYEIGAKLLDDETRQIVLDMATYDEITAMKDKINHMEIRISAYRLLEQTGRSYLDTEVLAMLANHFPAGVSADNMSFDASGNISITGSANAIDEVAYLISRLKQDERVKTVFVGNVTANNIATETTNTASSDADLAHKNIVFALSITLR
jgi:Tfp pilus assembly protein PilN